MAIQVSMGGGGGRGRRPLAALSDINIIPLVDVVLVLLVIFILTAHVMEFGLEIQVPSVEPLKATSEDLPVVTMSKASEIFLGDKPVNINELGAEVRRRYKDAKSVYVRADREATWEPLARVVGALGKAELQVRMVTQPIESGSRRK